MVVPAPTLAGRAVQRRMKLAIRAGETVAVYLQEKLGGEISIPRTDRSPEFSFDITLAHLRETKGEVRVERYGILEIPDLLT